MIEVGDWVKIVRNTDLSYFPKGKAHVIGVVKDATDRNYVQVEYMTEVCGPQTENLSRNFIKEL